MKRAKNTRDYLDILDQAGNVVGVVTPDGKMHGLGQGGTYVPWGSIGGNIWEFFHPAAVQAEYQAVGKEAPPVEDIMSGALEDTSARIQEGTEQAIAGFTQAGKWIVIGLVAYLLIQGVQLVQRGR